MEPSPQMPSTLVKTSLVLGITSAVFVFGIGLCALVGIRQGWIAYAGTVLFVCGATSAFMGLLGLVTGVGSLFDRRSSRTLPAVGILLSLVGMCLFLAVLAQVR